MRLPGTLAGITSESDLSGKVKAGGQTTLFSLVTPAGVHFRSTLTSSAFAIGPLWASLDDELLALSGGTLAQVLRSSVARAGVVRRMALAGAEVPGVDNRP
jgi:hypothetical protein